MKVFSWIPWIVGFAILHIFSVSAMAPLAQETYRIFIAPISDFAPDDDGGPTRHEYVTNFERRDECKGVLPTSREDLADFTAWFEFEGRHFVLLWDAQGDLVYSGGGVRSSGNIVKDVCNEIRSRGLRPSPNRPSR